MKKSKLILSFASFIVLTVFLSFFYFSDETKAQTSSPITGFATIVNSNHIVFSGSNGGSAGNTPFSVQYDTVTGNLSGYAWSDDYGWVDFNSANLDLTTFEMSGTAKVLSLQTIPSPNNDTETLNGVPHEWANGIITLSGSNGGSTGNMPFSVAFNPDGTANTTWHHAWGGNVLGWIDFSGVIIIPDLCTNIVGVQLVLEQGWTVAGTICDVCPNTIGVQNILPCTTAPSCNFVPPLSTITQGDSVDLYWSGTSVVSCVASGGWFGNKPISGNINVSPVSTKTYNLTCLGNNGTSTTCSATVSVVNCLTNPSDPACSVSCPVGQIFVNGECVGLSTSCTQAELYTYSTDLVTGINTPDNLYCYCSVPAQQVLSAPVDCVTFCLNNPSACKKKPHYIET